jgi:hypothetical protein
MKMKSFGEDLHLWAKVTLRGVTEECSVKGGRIEGGSGRDRECPRAGEWSSVAVHGNNVMSC